MTKASFLHSTSTRRKLKNFVRFSKRLSTWLFLTNIVDLEALLDACLTVCDWEMLTEALQFVSLSVVGITISRDSFVFSQSRVMGSGS